MLIRKSSKRSVRGAFTLVEMMIVVSIIVALAGIGITYMMSQAEEGLVGRAKADMKMIRDAAASYKLKSKGHVYPASMEELSVYQVPTMSPWNTPYELVNTGGRMLPNVSCSVPGVSDPLFFE